MTSLPSRAGRLDATAAKYLAMHRGRPIGAVVAALTSGSGLLQWNDLRRLVRLRPPFWFVAPAATKWALLLEPASLGKQEPTWPRVRPATWPVVLEPGAS